MSVNLGQYNLKIGGSFLGVKKRVRNDRGGHLHDVKFFGASFRR